MNPTTLLQMTGRVSQLLTERLGARGRNLREKVESRGRVLPRRVRKAATVLIEAEATAASPKMIRQADMTEISHAYDVCVRYLEPLGATERLRGGLLRATTSIVFVLVIVGVAALAVAKLRGLI